MPVTDLEIRVRDNHYNADTTAHSVGARDLTRDPVQVVLQPSSIAKDTFFLHVKGFHLGRLVAIDAQVLTFKPNERVNAPLTLHPGFIDEDDDGFEAGVKPDSDCNDTNPRINPFTLEDCNDYLWNVRLVTRFGYVDHRSAGVAGSAVQAYRKAKGDEVKRKMLERSEWFGTEKKREVWTLTLTDRWDTDGMYGTTRIHRFLTPEGNVAIWFATKESGIEIGETWKVKATVKKHGWRGQVKQTVLTRCDPLEKVAVAEEGPTAAAVAP